MSAPDLINLFIVEDHQGMIDGLKFNLNKKENLAVVGYAKGKKELFDALEKEKVDVLLLDTRLANGEVAADFIKELDDSYPEMKILIYSIYDDAKLIYNYLRNGAKGYVLKKENMPDLYQRILDAYNGKIALSDEVRDKYLQEDDKEKQISCIRLTARQKEVLKLVAKGLTSQQIADQWNRSIYTVETHRKDLLRKFEVSNVVELLNKARDLGFLD